MSSEAAWYVIDSQRRVWAKCPTPRAAGEALHKVRLLIREKKPARAPDPATLRIVKY